MMRRALIPLLAAGLLGGCDLAPRYARPQAPVPPAWPAGDAYGAVQDGAAGLPWRGLIADPKLTRVIEQALANNRDLRVALANVAAARAQYRVQRSAQLPTLTGGAGVTVSKASQSGGGGQDYYSGSIGISSFEIDLFGRVKNLSRAALEQYLASKEGARATHISLIAEVASAYAALAADQELLRTSQDTLASAERSLKLTGALNRAGLAPKVDVRQAESTVAQAQSDVESGTTQVAQDRNALDLLVGAPVDAALLPASLADLDKGVGLVPAGLSSQVLLARPDVLEAEHQLKAANADIGAARAAFFPRISLTAAIGVASGSLSSLFSDGSDNWSVAPSASLPVFGGANRGNLAFSKAQRDASLAQYEKAIQSAFRDVSDALARAGTIDRQRAAQQALVSSSEDAYRLADARYRSGVDSFLNALVSQRTYFAARRSAIATVLAAVDNRITLYRAIGSDSPAGS